MGLYTGGLIIGRIFTSEIWGAYFREGLFIYVFIYLFIYSFIIIIFVLFFVFLGGGLGLLSEFYGMPHHFVCLVLLLKTERKKLVCGSADFAFFAPGLRILAINKRIRGFENTVDRGSLLKNLARVPDSVCLEVRIMDRVINFRFPFFGILVFSVPSFYSTEHCISLFQNYKHRQKY